MRFQITVTYEHVADFGCVLLASSKISGEKKKKKERIRGKI